MSPQCETPCPSAEERRWWLLRNSFLLCSVSITRNRERIRMAQRKCGSLSVENTWFLGPACSSVLFLSRHILLSEACSTCDCGLRCKCDRNVGKDVRPVSFHINWGEPGKYLDALSGKDCQGGFLWDFSLHASSRRERDHIQSNAEVGVEIKTLTSYFQWELVGLTSPFCNGPKLHGNHTTSHPFRTNCDFDWRYRVQKHTWNHPLRFILPPIVNLAVPHGLKLH